MAQRMRRPAYAAVLALLLAFAVIPFWWMGVTSVKPDKELYSIENPLFPANPTFEHYIYLFESTDLLIWLRNSLIVSAVAALLAVSLALPAGYAISRYRTTHTKLFGLSLMLGYGFMPILLVLPMFALAVKTGLYNSLSVLCLVYPSFLIPVAAWLMAGYFAEVPVSVEHAAQLDGCGVVRTILYSAIPCARNGLVATFVFCFLLSWGEYVYALGLTSSSRMRTLPVGLATLESGDVYAWGSIMGAALLSTVPVLLLLIIARRRLAHGLSIGVIKRDGSNRQT